MRKKGNTYPSMEHNKSSPTMDKTQETTEMSEKEFSIFTITKLNEMQKKTDNQF